MEKYGFVIRTLRKQRGMTQAELAGDVCSLKHLYSIERGIRTPSGFMLGQLGRKLEVNLFAYMPYLDCADPVAMKEAMDRMSKYRRQLRYRRLMCLRKEFECIEDFRHPPWSYELDLNEYTTRIVAGDQLAQQEQCLRRQLAEVERGYFNEPVCLELQTVLALCLMAESRCKEALPLMEDVLERSAVTLLAPRGREYHLLFRIIEMVICFNDGQYQEAIEKSKVIERLEKEWNLFEMGYFWPFVRAASHAALGRRQESLEAYLHGICLCLSVHRDWALSVICSFVGLRDLSARYRNDHPLVAEFLSRYPFLRED